MFPNMRIQRLKDLVPGPEDIVILLGAIVNLIVVMAVFAYYYR